MDVRIDPGGRIAGVTRVPGNKSIAHRWLILAAAGAGRSALAGLPRSLDVRSTASCLAAVAPAARASLEAWARNGGRAAEGHGSTWNRSLEDASNPVLEVEGEGWPGIRPPDRELDCGNSGTTMRLLTGVGAGSPFVTLLVGDASLSSRPMERVAEPLRLMGARIATTSGHAPVRVEGGGLHGIRYSMPIPSAQVKGAILLAGLVASGETIVAETISTRDHTERALSALGAPARVVDGSVRVSAFQHDGFRATVPGDPSSAAFLVAAAALTGGGLTVRGLGLNPSRLGFLGVMERMGIETRFTVTSEGLGEPVGDLQVAPGERILPVRVEEAELPIVIDEVPVLALLAAHATGGTTFLGAEELRVKESDRLTRVADAITDLGGIAAVEGDRLVVAGGGLEGGIARSGGDHRIAMAAVVGALGARRPSRVQGIEDADVSFPGFVETLRSLAGRLEVEG